MKRVLLFFAVVAATVLSACDRTAVTVTVSNNSDIDRLGEVVEIGSSLFADRLSFDEGFVVFDGKGAEVPSQYVADESDSTRGTLLLLVDVDASSSAEYKILNGVPSEYTAMAYGRFVPERMDDFAWENNIIGFRAYGKALEFETVSPGIDIWCKSTDRMVVDDWYRNGDYHNNHGQGMDCYKVGVSLGAGASAPLVGDTIRFGRNFTDYRIMANGPLRVSFTLFYPADTVGDLAFSRQKTISLDANSNFFHVSDLYSGGEERNSIAVGVVRHEGSEIHENTEFFATFEPASDSRDPARDGNIAHAIVLPKSEQGRMIGMIQQQSVFIVDKSEGEVLDYYAGAGWSQGNVADMQSWIKIVEQFKTKIDNPLTVEIR